LAHFKKSIPVFNHISKSNVDSEAGIIKNVVIVNAGLDKCGDNIDSTFLNQIAEQGKSQSQGVKARFGHPNMCDDALGTYIGRYKNFSISGNSVIADLHLDQTAKESPKGDLYSYVLKMAVANPDMFGNSIVFSPDEPAMAEEKNDSGDTITKEYIRCKAFIASDVVDSPAATNSLFKSETDFAAKATDFLDNNSEIFELLHKSPNLLTEFLTKYSNYKSQMENKKSEGSEQLNLIQKSIAAITEFITGASKSKSIGVTTVDGTAITVETNDADAKIGDACTIDNAPAPDGEYKITDGNTITVAGGKITEIKPTENAAADPVEESAPAESEEVKSLRAANSELLAKLESQENEFKEVQKNISELTAKLKSMKIDFTIDSASASSQTINKLSAQKTEVKSAYARMKEKESEKK